MDGTCFVALLIYTPLPHRSAAAGWRAWYAIFSETGQQRTMFLLTHNNTLTDRQTAVLTERQAFQQAHRQFLHYWGV